MNCLDVLILPSKNEGLPLVTVEAIACGANVVGSDVGGISEAIGKEFCFELNDNFVDNISSKVVELLYKPQLQTLSNVFNWKNTAIKENTIYKKILQI
jgi:teichuronic acid biosynthesis glycosyltransferase TuaC